jgi:hypothetical protein
VIYALSILGAALVTSQKTKIRLAGFAVWLLSNGLWGVDAYFRSDFQQVALWSTYQVFNFLGVINCIKLMRREKKK